MRVECEDLRRPDIVEEIKQGSLDRDDKDGDGEVPAVSEQFAKNGYAHDEKRNLRPDFKTY